jgi:hypothetical protein
MRDAPHWRPRGGSIVGGLIDGDANDFNFFSF